MLHSSASSSPKHTHASHLWWIFHPICPVITYHLLHNRLYVRCIYRTLHFAILFNLPACGQLTNTAYLSSPFLCVSLARRHCNRLRLKWCIPPLLSLPNTHMHHTCCNIPHPILCITYLLLYSRVCARIAPTEQCSFLHQTSNLTRFNWIDLPAKLLDYILSSNKSVINHH